MADIEEEARAWLANYHGSIDATALTLAYIAGASRPASPATREAVDPLGDEVQAVLTEQAGLLNVEAERVRAAFEAAGIRLVREPITEKGDDRG